MCITNLFMGKSNVVTFRLSDEELAAVENRAKALGMGRSTYLRRAAVHFAGGTSVEEIEALGFPEAVRTLRGTANNLNQLARAANRGGLLWDGGDARIVEAVRRETAEILSLYVGFLDVLRARRMTYPEVTVREPEAVE